MSKYNMEWIAAVTAVFLIYKYFKLPSEYNGAKIFIAIVFLFFLLVLISNLYDERSRDEFTVRFVGVLPNSKVSGEIFLKIFERIKVQKKHIFSGFTNDELEIAKAYLSYDYDDYIPTETSVDIGRMSSEETELIVEKYRNRMTPAMKERYLELQRKRLNTYIDEHVFLSVKHPKSNGYAYSFKVANRMRSLQGPFVKEFERHLSKDELANIRELEKIREQVTSEVEDITQKSDHPWS